MSKIKRIHVNQHNIKRNRKEGSHDPIFTVKTYKTNDYGHGAIIYGHDGKEAARLIYQPDKPLSCGARVWIETICCVEILCVEILGDEKSSVKVC